MQSLCLLGIVGMLDPPRFDDFSEKKWNFNFSRDGAAEAIRVVKESGVDVKMITGDAPETAVSIGKTILIVFFFNRKQTFLS